MTLSSLDSAIRRSNALISTVRDVSSGSSKSFGSEISSGGGFSGLDGMRSSAASRERYALFRGWAYSAVHALCTRGSRQPAMAGVRDKMESSDENRSRLVGSSKSSVFRMPKQMRKMVDQGFEVVPGHPALDVLESPNPIQNRVQFSYSFIASLALTGWSYLLKSENEEGRIEVYTVPTTWVTPDHRDGPFSRFKIQNPKKPQTNSDKSWYDRSQVGFAHLPNPSDPLSALAPAASQSRAIRIDDHIQTSQEVFFNNGIFPSVIVVAGKNQNPNTGGGVGGTRPRLSGGQRRGIHAAIAKMMSNVANYGNPAIIDGIIEDIRPLSMTNTEMGWDKSEDKVRSRILSAYGVHDYMLGNPVNVGGYAQTYSIERVFCERVNAYLEMLSCLLTNWLAPDFGQDGLVLWFEECEAHDPDQERRWYAEGRKNADITRNEFRSRIGLPPVDGGDGERNKLLDNPVAMSSVAKMLADVGLASPEAVGDLLVLFLGEEARSVVVRGEGGLEEGDQQIEEIADMMEEAVASLRGPVEVSLADDLLAKYVQFLEK